MEVLNRDTKRYVEMFAQRTFSEDDFVSLLLPLLRKNGIFKINEQELKKKLYKYYKNPEFAELFQDIVPERVSMEHDKCVDIHSGLAREKFLGGNVIADRMHPDNLILCYGLNDDVSYFEKYLSPNGKKKMQQLAKEFGIRNMVEKTAPKALHIYGTDPNCEYFYLSNGKTWKEEHSWELLTDGDIAKFQKDTEKNPNAYYESAEYPNVSLPLEDAVSSIVKLENASYAVLQGIVTGEIRRVKVYTNLLDVEKLKQISEAGCEVVPEHSSYLEKEKPSIKKYVLK